MMYISQESASSTQQYWPAAFDGLVTIIQNAGIFFYILSKMLVYLNYVYFRSISDPIHFKSFNELIFDLECGHFVLNFQGFELFDSIKKLAYHLFQFVPLDCLEKPTDIYCILLPTFAHFTKNVVSKGAGKQVLEKVSFRWLADTNMRLLKFPIFRLVVTINLGCLSIRESTLLYMLQWPHQF